MSSGRSETGVVVQVSNFVHADLKQEVLSCRSETGGVVMQI